MPYVKVEKRMDMAINLASLGGLIETAGDLNYAISKLMLHLAEKHGANYAAYNEVIGAVECAKIEFYRRVIQPYEEKKRKENGDVY